jgi:polysaccharide chain length determinant protein (PEP-CTERM system associated)
VSLVTNTLASFYIEENLKARERQAHGTAEFLRVQLGETKNRLDQQEQRVSEFKRRHMGELPEQLAANLATLEGLQAQLRLNADHQTRAIERRQTLASQLAEAETMLLPGATVVAAPTGQIIQPESPDARLVRLKEDLAALRTQFNEKYPDVVKLKGEVAALERQQAEAKTREPQEREKEAAAAPVAATPFVLRLREALSEAQADIKIYKGEEMRLRESIATYQARVEKVPRREQEFRELSRDYETTRDLYQSLLKRYEEAQLAESLEQRQKGEQFRLLDPALPNPDPAAPNRVKWFIAALVGSIALAVGSVMLAEHHDTSFHAIDDLRAFSAVPVLVSIPCIMTGADRRRRRWRMRLAASAAVIGLLLIVTSAYLVAHGNEGLVSLLARSGGS